MELFTLLIFCAVLLLCVVLKLSVLYALGAGALIFCLYGRKKGFSWGQLGKMLLDGAATAKNVVFIVGMMGVVAGLWRACGTIPYIICAASGFVRPGTVVLMTFLMNAGVSMLMGSAFGVSATMGAISMTMAAAMGVDPVLAGGAMLSGVFVGDRAAPVSSSALLISELTHTDLFDNLKQMLRRGAVPFLLCCALYGGAGLLMGSSGGQTEDLWALFGRELTLHWAALIPAAAILLLSFLRVPTKKTVAVSILLAAAVCLLVQRLTPAQTLRAALLGFRAGDAQVAAMLNGGGLISMVKSMCIVGLSSSYSGIFRQTPLLAGIRANIRTVGDKFSPMGAMILTALATGAIACNQTLCILMTHQLCEGTEDDQELALDLSDTAEVLAAPIPWSISGGVPLASAGAPTASLLTAFFLYLVPLHALLGHLRKRSRGRPVQLNAAVSRY